MGPRVGSREVESWAGWVLDDEPDGSEPPPHTLAELKADLDYASALLDRLADHRDPVVRSWAGTAAKGLFGRDAVPLLLRLTADRDPDVRDAAREDLEAIDPEFLLTMLPSLRRVLERARDPHGEDRAAMWRVAGLRDSESVPILRVYAARNDPREYGYRMPHVLADYIEDPASVARRIGEHDHDWMFWLVEAASLLPVPGAVEAFAEALALPVDGTCAEIIRTRPNLPAKATRPP